MIFIMLLAFDQPEPPSPCVIDSCEKEICVVETPEGWVEVERKPDYEEGDRITCPLWLIEPT
tara:strand:- start:110 stop:295 length:186 start_codon:yes stop_codon:yes gene_type:complete